MREGLRSNARQEGERDMLDLNKDPSENKMAASDSSSSTDYFSAQEGGRDVDSSVNMDVTGNADAGDDGKGGEGGKEEQEKNPKTVGGETSEGFSGEAESHLPSSNVSLTREEMRDAETLGFGKDAATVGVVDTGVSSGADIRGEAAGKKRRGRKRKVVESGLPIDGGQESDPVKEESSKFAKVEEGGSKPDGLEDSQDADMVGDVAADTGGNTGECKKEASKGRRGRKRKVLQSSGGNKDSGDIGNHAEKLTTDGDGSPQIVGRVLRSRTIAATVGEKHASGKEIADVGDGEIVMDVDRSGKRSTKREITKENADVGDGEMEMDADRSNKRSTRKKGTSASRKSNKEKTKDKKEGEMGRKEEKQLLKNQIISILKEAGWTIEYRPRMRSEYLDAVYVDHQGRTYWSVTLAYKKLKQMVEDGTADAKALSAFTPIPENKLSKLFRITKEKEKEKEKEEEEKCEKLPKVGGSKTGKGGKNARPDKKSAAI